MVVSAFLKLFRFSFSLDEFKLSVKLSRVTSRMDVSSMRSLFGMVDLAVMKLNISCFSFLHMLLINTA